MGEVAIGGWTEETNGGRPVALGQKFLEKAYRETLVAGGRFFVDTVTRNRDCRITNGSS